jgi:hypothetical protein
MRPQLHVSNHGYSTTLTVSTAGGASVSTVSTGVWTTPPVLMARPPSSYIVQIFTAVGYTPLPWTSGCPGSAYLSGSAE